MARKLRIQFPGAIYHVVNRGNYRRDLFATPGEALAFLDVIREARALMGWRVHAYALLKNHYHLALETPEPNLVEGMHWLQTTWATRFNRFRQERGHLFQGRYHSVLVEDAAALARVVDYIHLNPIRAKILAPELVGRYRWSSLPGIIRGTGWADGRGWSAGERFSEDAIGRMAYERYLIEIGQDEAAWEARGLVGLSKGWAIGSPDWRRRLAAKYHREARQHGMEQDNIRDLRLDCWEASLAANLKKFERTEKELESKPMKQEWKLRLAAVIRKQSGAPPKWLADRLHLGTAATLRGYLCKAKKQNTA